MECISYLLRHQRAHTALTAFHDQAGGIGIGIGVGCDRIRHSGCIAVSKRPLPPGQCTNLGNGSIGKTHRSTFTGGRSKSKCSYRQRVNNCLPGGSIRWTAFICDYGQLDLKGISCSIGECIVLLSGGLCIAKIPMPLVDTTALAITFIRELDRSRQAHFPTHRKICPGLRVNGIDGFYFTAYTLIIGSNCQFYIVRTYSGKLVYRVAPRSGEAVTKIPQVSKEVLGTICNG